MAAPSSDPRVDDLLRRYLDDGQEHALILLDRDGHIVAWLAAAELVFGYAVEEALGRPHTILFTPEDIALGVPQKEIEIACRGVPAEDDRWLVRKDGQRFWATGVMEAVRDDAGGVIGFVKTLRNRTDLKGQLEGLDNRIRQLEAANGRKNTFISTLAHELRSPLATACHAIELMKRSLPDSAPNAEPLSEYLALAERQLNTIRGMIDELLDTTRISTGKVQLQLKKVAIGEILSAAADTCRAQLRERSHQFHMILGEAPIFVAADAARLQRVFVNLMQNAIKFTENGGSVWVKLFPEGDDAVVKFEDTGIGIAPDVLPQIFDLFTQAEFIGDQPGAGLGLGLSVVKDLTQLHGGSVQVRSDGVGKGSEFVVRLPRVDVDQGVVDGPAASSSP